MALNIIALGVILTGLYFGAGFLIPIVIAFIIMNVLEAMIEQLQKHHVPKYLAMFISVVVVVTGIAMFGLILVSQANEFADAAPKYFERLKQLSTSLISGLDESWVQRLQKFASSIDVSAAVSSALGSVSTLFGHFTLVVLYVGFLLAERGMNYRRFVSIGRTKEEKRQYAQILDNISEGMRQYLFVKTILSLMTSFLSYIVLKYLKVDFAETWAAIIFLLNWIPSIGSVLGVVFPAIIALLQFDTLGPFLIIAVFLTIVQFAIGNILEPMLMGRSLDLGLFTVMVALTFWSMIWGIAGAFLSIPITASIMIICRELDGWRWVATLLSGSNSSDLAASPKVKPS